MKKFVKGRWFPLIAAAIAAVIVALVMALFGWKITYAPDLENSWDAISAVAAWAGIIMSFVAIMTAIWTPIRIANRQDKISLFEKRMRCYSTIQNICAFARQISDLTSKKEIQAAVKIYFGEANLFSENQNATWYTITLKHQEPILVEGVFLFPEYNEEMLQDLLMDIIALSGLVAVKTREEAEDPISDIAQTYKAKICNMCSNLETTLIPLMERELQLYMR